MHVEVSDIAKGIFILLALHYIYDIQYHPRLKDFYLFFEENFLNINAPSNFKKSATYLNVNSSIKCYLDDP